MKIAIMQPYFFPYIGYFQLIANVDHFVVFDDVNFIKRGWMNRNFILNKNDKFAYTLPVQKQSQNKRINEHFVLMNNEVKTKLSKQIQHSYSNSPYYSDVSLLIQDVLEYKEENLALFLANALKKTIEFIGFNTTFSFSSALNIGSEYTGENRIIEICKYYNATEYHNLPGGKELYHQDHFLNMGCVLHFIQPNLQPYKQYANPFISHLSIIDTLMFNSRSKVKKMLEQPIECN